MAAEKILSTIAANVLSSLGSYAIQHIGLAWGVKGELRKMETNISTINNILQDAQEQQMSNRAVKEWLERLKLILYDAEDLLDEVATETKRRQVESLMRKVHHFFTSSNQLVFRYVVCRKIRDIGKRLDEIVLQMNAFKFVVKLVERPIQINRREETSSFVNTVTVIGRDADKEKLVRLLLSSGDEENVAIIPIVGMGGLGKTTLVQLVYNDHRIQNHFTKRLWVCISNDFDIKRILIKILQANEQHGNINSYKHEGLSQLQNRVRNMLSDGNFLLFLDDVWNEDRVEWKKLEDLLITCARGIRIVVTTRSKMVASIVRTSTMEPYELQGLSDNDCLDIFVKWAFKEGDENKHQNLVKIGREIVKKCGGVPLAARTLGALLFSKTNERDWLAMRDSDMRALVQKENDILPILRLSYDQMPSNLKQCFAYCSLFEKDKIIDRKKLLYAWIAQGFVQCLERNEELEHIAESYLEELVRRCFLEPYHASTYFDLGGRERYIMHDLVHDLTQYVAGNEFLTIKGATEAIPDTVRHVSFESNTYCKSPRVLIKAKKLRTIFYPSKTEPAFESCVQLEIASFRCLRVLEGCRSQDNIFLLEKIGKLKLLRYLSLNGVGSLPKSLCELLNLQYLDLSESQVFELPEDFGKLINLRFLCLSTRLTRLPKNEIGRLTSLRTLIIYRCLHLSSLGEGIEHLSCLQELVLDSCDELLSLPTGFSHLTSLEHLEISFCQRLNFSDDDDLKELRSLRKLRLQALPGLVSLPKGLQDAADIRELVLDSCDELLSLPTGFSHLTSLEHLEISFCQRLNFSDDDDLKGLRSLRKLRLQALPGLVSLPNGLQDAADIRELVLDSCDELVSLPASFRHLPSLECLEISFCRRLNFSDDNDLKGLRNLKKLILQALPGLVSLPKGLQEAADTLTQLEILSCWNFTSPSESVLPNLLSLQSLRIWHCHKVQSMPEGMQRLTQLHYLNIFVCYPNPSRYREGGEDWPKIGHVPIIDIF